MRIMKSWMEDQGIEFPQSGDDFHKYAARFFMQDIETLKDGKFGFIDGKLVSAKITYEFKDFRNMNLV